MTDQVADTAPVATSTDTAPVKTDVTATTTNPTTTAISPTDTTTQPEFKIPDTYKDKSWAGKIKSQDDVYKMIDNLDQVVGKKVVQAIDYSKATPEEITAYHAKLAPEDKSVYKFGEQADKGFAEAISDVFQKNGINEYQGNQIIKAVNEITQKLGESKIEADTSLDGYKKLLNDSFGDKGEKVANAVEAHLKETFKDADPETQKVLDNMPNDQRILLDKIIYKTLEKYGAAESGAQGEVNGKGTITTDPAAQRAKIRGEMRELEKRSHTQAEKDALQQKLNALL